MGDMEEFDTSYTDLITCPYCGEVNRDSWEIDWDGELDCGSCEKEFIVYRHPSISYSTHKKTEK